jgi:hypothetical protein
MEANITSLQLIIDGTQNPTCGDSRKYEEILFFIFILHRRMVHILSDYFLFQSLKEKVIKSILH